MIKNEKQDEKLNPHIPKNPPPVPYTKQIVEHKLGDREFSLLKQLFEYITKRSFKEKES